MMKFNKIKSLIESNKELKLTKNNNSEIVIESSRSANKLKASLKENKLKITLENEVGGEIENYESTVINSEDLVDKIKDAINLYDMIDELNIDFEESEELPVADEVGEEIELMDIEQDCTCPECDPETNNPVGDFDNDGEDEELLNEETNPFSEIIDMMSNAESYDELYTAAELIKDDSLRMDVEQLIGQCEDDGDEVNTAYSVVTSDLLDNKVNDLNERKLPKLESVDEFEASKYKGNEWGVFAKKSRAWVLFGTEKEMKERAEELNSRKEESLEDTEITSDTDEVSTSSKLLDIQNSVTDTAKELGDLATEVNDTEMMSVIMDLANSVSSCALDIEDAIETIDDLEESEEGEELEQVDATNENESLLLKLRMNLTESRLIAKKLARKDSENKGLYEKYINSVNEIL